MLIQVGSRKKTDQPQDIEMDLGAFISFALYAWFARSSNIGIRLGARWYAMIFVLPLLQPSKMMGDLHKYVEEQEN
jgi:hypothetical protein